MEFDQVVQYGFGDDIRDVDWNVTARLGQLYRKVFVEEREITVFVVVADDPALQFGSGTREKREVLFDLAALTLMLAVANRERAALLHLKPGGAVLHPPTRRRARVLAAIADLFAAEPPSPVARPGPPISPMDLGRPPRGALVIWLGEVPREPPPPEWAAVRRHHPTIGIRVEDAWERQGPGAGGFAAYDVDRHDLVWLDDTPASRAAHARWREAREGVWAAWWPDPLDRLAVDAAADPLTALVGFLSARSRASARRGLGAA